MKRQVSAISFGLALVAFSMSSASADENCKTSGRGAAANTTYTQQHALDIGDVPGHQVRVFELHHTYPADAEPNCEGLRRKEDWVRGFSDYTDRNGPNWGYTVIILENGDKIFPEFRGISQTVVGPDGAKKSTAVSVAKFTGGTGRYQAVRGVERSNTIFDLDKQTNEVRYEGEYWFDK